MHTSIATAILEQVKILTVNRSVNAVLIDQIAPSRRLLRAGGEVDVLGRQGFVFGRQRLVRDEEREKVFPTHFRVYRKSLSETLDDPECGTPEDRLRLLLIHYLCSGDDEVDKLAEALQVSPRQELQDAKKPHFSLALFPPASKCKLNLHVRFSLLSHSGTGGRLRSGGVKVPQALENVAENGQRTRYAI